MLAGERHVDQDVFTRGVHQVSQFGEFRAQGLGDGTPLVVGGLGGVLREDGLQHGDDGGPLLGRHVGQEVTHPIDSAALVARMEHLGRRSAQPFVVVGDDQLDAAQAAVGKLAQERQPEGLRLRRTSTDGPVPTPSTSRRPSVLTATAIITAVDRIRPAERHLMSGASSQR